jgi:diguanylate cyclase (GGDEF)-like protein
MQKCAPEGGGPAHGPLALAARQLSAGHRWLRFPAALESQFQAEALEPRRSWMLACGLVGFIAICLGSLKLGALMPDATEVALRNLYWILASTAVVFMVVWRMPKAWRRPWQMEAATTLPILAVNVGVIHDCTMSMVDSTFTHSAALVSTLMFGCIAARLRFVWSLGSAAASFAAYAVFVQARTPQQALIVSSTLSLMAVSYVFALVSNYAFEHADRRHWLLRQVERQQREALKAASERMHRLSMEDPLTRLFNRRQFDAELGMAWSKAVFAKAPLAMLMVDVDHFKRYNDTHGHPAGDACLKQVSRLLEDVAHAHGGTAARLGGEEFGVLLPTSSLAQAQAAGDDLCERLRSAALPHGGAPSGHVSVSVGAAQVWPRQGSGSQSLVDLADQALYQAKTTGRDRCCGVLIGQAPSDEVVDSGLPDSHGDGGDHGEGAEVIPMDEHRHPEAVFARILEAGHRQLRFPPEQEAAYQAHHGQGRGRQLSLMVVIGLALYDVIIWLNRDLFSDVADTLTQGVIALNLVVAPLLPVFLWPRLPAVWREGLYTLGTVIMGVGTACLLGQSRELTALAFAVALALIPMFAGVGARQSLRLTLVSAVLTCLAAALSFHPVGDMQKLVFADSVTMVITNSIFTLILAYSQEHSTRKAWLLSRIERLQGEALQVATDKLQALSMRDPLTGISNRRQFEIDLKRLWSESLPTRRHLALAVVDIDFFKCFNDTQGHPMGDRCLQQVATTIQQVVEAHRGLAARLGGEEFGILLPGEDAARARQVAQQVCEAVRQLRIPHAHSQVPGQAIVTVSVGVSGARAASQLNPQSLFSRADEALYDAKHLGRNQVSWNDVNAAHQEPAFAEPNSAASACA